MRLAAVLAAALLATSPAVAQDSIKSHGLSICGDLKYPPDFKHFDYVNPDAPKGGTLRIGVIGTTFDTLNAFIVKGNPAANIGNVIRPDDALARRAGQRIRARRRERRGREGPLLGDLHSAQGGAFSRRQPDDARGRHVDVRDAAARRAQPFYRSYYGDVTKVEKEGERGVASSRCAGQPRIAADPRPDARASQEIVGDPRVRQDDAGAAARQRSLKIETFEPGRSITYAAFRTIGARTCRSTGAGSTSNDRLRLLPRPDRGARSVQGRTNTTSASRTRRNTGRPAMTVRHSRDGLLSRRRFRNQFRAACRGSGSIRGGRCSRTRACGRRSPTRSISNGRTRTCSTALYSRTPQLFRQFRIRRSGVPQGDELKILEPYPRQGARRGLHEGIQAAEYDGSGNIRDGLREALKLLKEAGWERQERESSSTTRPASPSSSRSCWQGSADGAHRNAVRQEPRSGWASPRGSARSTPRNTRSRMDDFDFDMVVRRSANPSSPGNEQREFWGSEKADEPGSRNMIGHQEPGGRRADRGLIQAPDREPRAARDARSTASCTRATT